MQKRSRVMGVDPVVLWRPEDVRHVPMMAEHDTGKKKAKKNNDVNVAVVEGETRKMGPGRKKKKPTNIVKKKIKI
jgi:hypothetical protein